MLAFQLQDYLQFLVSGVSTGAIYVLIALGLITIYNVTGVINLAQGEFVMLGAMVAVALARLHLPLALSALGAVAAAAAFGGLVHRLTIVPARQAPDVALIIITIGTAIAIRGAALFIWGTMPRSLPEFSPGVPLVIGGAVLSRQRLWIMGTAAAVLLFLYLFFEHTLLGKAVRACSINRQAAELIGVDARTMGTLAYILGAALSAIGGIVIAPLTLVSYDMGLMLGLKGFVVAIMGSLTRAPAAVVGGILLGILEAFTSGLWASGFKDGIAFLALFGLLLVRTIPWRDLWRRAA